MNDKVRPDPPPIPKPILPPKPVEPPKPPPKIVKPEDALAQANYDQGGNVHGKTHEQTIANLTESRNEALDAASKQGRLGDIHTINQAFDQAQARLDADNVAAQFKPEAPKQNIVKQTP